MSPEEAAKRAVKVIVAKMATDMDEFALGLEQTGIEMSGPAALRKFAEIVRKASEGPC